MILKRICDLNCISDLGEDEGERGLGVKEAEHEGDDPSLLCRAGHVSGRRVLLLQVLK